LAGQAGFFATVDGTGAGAKFSWPVGLAVDPAGSVYVTEAGVDPSAMWRQVYETGTIGRLKLIAELFSTMRLEAGGRLAVLSMDDALMARTEANHDETDMLINMPLSSRPVEAVAMFKSVDGTGTLRVSLRSKGDLDVRAIAQRYGGGGHRNAAGFTAPANDEPTRERIVADVVEALGKTEHGHP